MPDILSVWLREQFRLAKPLLKSLSIQADRAAQDKLGELKARSFGGRVTYTPVSLSHCEAEWAMSKQPAEGTAILYLHGGGYTAGSLAYARGFGGVLAEKTGRATLCVAYRLAPEDPYPAALDDAREAYLRLLSEGYAPEKLLVIGESAGGGLLLCLCHDLRARGVPLPAALVPISPWTDLTLSGKSYDNNEHRDPSLYKEKLAYSAMLYAAGSLNDPLVSPLFGDFTGFPPMLVFAGSEELLLDDSVQLAERCRAVGVDCELVVEQGMWHVYVLFGVAEARAAVARIVSFCDRHVPRLKEADAE